MNDLYVIDASALVYVGTKAKGLCEKRYYNYPVGGIHYLMRHVGNALRELDSVVICFDSPNFRKEMDSGYKPGRKSSPDVLSQLEVLYEGLLQCGINCLKMDGYEADDLIDWVVQANVGKYNSIVIVGNDYDLCHSIQSGVRFKSIVQGIGCIHVGNFEERVDLSSYTKFNTISAKKSFCGCKSDGIPAMALSNGLKGKELYEEFLKFLDGVKNGNSYTITSNWKMPLIFANVSKLFTVEEWEELERRVKLVYPAECPGGINLDGTDMGMVNKNALYKFLSLYGDYDSIKNVGGKKVTLSESEINELRRKSSYLSSGEFAADRSLQHEPKVATKTLNLDCFEKEF